MQVKALKWLAGAVIAVTGVMVGSAVAQPVTTFAQLRSAIAEVPATGTETAIEIGAGFAVDAAVRIPASRNVKLTSAGGGAYTLSRASGFKGNFFVVETGGKLSIENLILDGGRSGGSTKNRSLVRAAGAFALGAGAVLRNNDGCAGGADCPNAVVQYAVTFNTDGGTPGTVAAVFVNSGGTLGTNFPANPTKSGHTFGGWFDGAAQYTSSTTITKDVALVASWTVNTYTVTVSGGGTGASGGGSYAAGATVNITAGTRTGYTFSGWTSSPAVTFANASNAATTFTMPSSAVTVTANWTAVGGPVGDSYTETAGGLNFKMIAVEGGTFTMGCTAEQGSDCYSDESPASSVTLSDFYIGEFEVTQGLWQQVVGTSMPTSCGSYGVGDDYPAYCVSWNDIVNTFIPALNTKTGKTYRLPTEAEWEYAARGGKNSGGYKYSGSNNIDDVAWYSSNSGSSSKQVGTKAANELGIYDMSGNVWEWVHDWYGSYTSDAKTNPQGPTSGSARVYRGGSWDIGAQDARVSGYRAYDGPDSGSGSMGFRLAVSSVALSSP